MAKPLLSYWDIRGLAEPCRLMLEYCGSDYDQKLYVCGDAPKYDSSSWTDVKPTLGLDFPNLPYYIDGDTKITESWAIMKHIARSNKKLLPTTDVEHDRCDMLQGVIGDFRGRFVRLCYGPGFEENKSKFFEGSFPGDLQKFDKYLSDKTWLAGDNLTFVDFALCEILDHIRTMEPGCFDKYETVSKYLEKFFNLEKIATYRQSSRFKKFPINNKMANWGGKLE